MDGLNRQGRQMPPPAPLPMRAQSFRTAPLATPGGVTFAGVVWRSAAFVPTLALTAGICAAIGGYLRQGGVSAVDAFVMALFSISVVWLVFSVNTACLGLARAKTRCRPKSHRHDTGPTALLMPVYNETPWDVFGNASAMMQELRSVQSDERFALFILSDTRDPEIAAAEEQAFAALQAEQTDLMQVHYRRRDKNTDKKIGNISDWIESWGGAYWAMVVLDADSLMSGAAIRRLTRALASDPQAGLIQSRPTLIGAQTLFGRVQQFSNAVYGWLSAEGLESWSQKEGNYWGHNAIIRTRAFADSARLPYMRGFLGKPRLVLSHDFVEAGMLRRAGWHVRMLPEIGGSYEEAPQTLIDYIQRDRRWCHGNMQHLRLLGVRGFHAITRLHLLHGALAFLMSPIWLSAVVLWAFVGIKEDAPSVYFSPANPLMPKWPEAASEMGWIFAIFVYGMLLFPKIVSAVVFGLRRRTRAAYGSDAVFVGSVCFEVALSVLFAPIMMVQHTKATFFALLGGSSGWAPQNRSCLGYTWGQTLRFHWIETISGAALLAGMMFANVPLLILPIAFSLAFAAPLSKLGSLPVTEAKLRVIRLDTPHTLREPRIVRLARQERAWIKQVLAEPSRSDVIAAE